jgi:hypothetical protein
MDENLLNKDAPERIKLLDFCLENSKKFPFSLKSKILFEKLIAITQYEICGMAGNKNRIFNEFIQCGLLEKRQDGIYIKMNKLRSYIKDSVYITLARKSGIDLV